jgi:hypothetical protein
MEHGSFFFQPISFKLEQFMYMLFKEPVVKKSKGKLTLMGIKKPIKI